MSELIVIIIVIVYRRHRHHLHHQYQALCQSVSISTVYTNSVNLVLTTSSAEDNVKDVERTELIIRIQTVRIRCMEISQQYEQNVMEHTTHNTPCSQKK